MVGEHLARRAAPLPSASSAPSAATSSSPAATAREQTKESDVAEEVEEEINEDIADVHDESANFGRVVSGNGIGEESMEGDTSIDGGVRGESAGPVGTESLVSIGSVESADLVGMSTMGGDSSFDHGGFQSVASVPTELESQDFVNLAGILNEATVKLLRDPSRAWMISTLQDLYKMTKARKFPNRYAFYDAVALKFLQPLQAETQQLKEALLSKEKFYGEKLRREVCDLALQLESFQSQRSLLERQKQVLEEQLLKVSRDFTRLHSQHLALTDIMRLLSLGTIDYHAVLASKRTVTVRADVAAAAHDNAQRAAREREKLLSEKARFQEAFHVLLEYWSYLPQDARPDVSQRLVRSGIKTLHLDDGTDLYLPPGTTNNIVRAIYGDLDAPTPTPPATAKGYKEPSELPWADVTEALRGVLVKVSACVVCARALAHARA
jgi:hypothetical protein